MKKWFWLLLLLSGLSWGQSVSINGKITFGTTVTQIPNLTPLGTTTQISDDAANGNGIFLVCDQTSNCTNGQIGDLINTINKIYTNNLYVQQSSSTGSTTAGSLVTTGPTPPTATGQCGLGSVTAACTSTAVSSGAGAAALCIQVSCGGVNYLMPLFALPSGGGSSTIPTPPGTAFTLSNIHLQTGNPGTITICNSTTNCNAGTSNGIGVATTTYNVATPSVSGAATQMQNVTASGTVNVSGKLVTWVSGTPFNTGWDAATADGTGTATITGTAVVGLTGSAFSSAWVGDFFVQGTTLCTITGFTDSTHMTLADSGCAGTNVTYHAMPLGKQIVINGIVYAVGYVNSSTQLLITSSGGTGTGQTYGSNTGFNTLWYRHLGSTAGSFTNLTVQNIISDFYFYPNSAGNIDGYEFDPDLGTVEGGQAYAYKASLACYISNNKFYLYNAQTHAWVTTNNTCNWFGTGANQWHHVRMYVTYDHTAHTYTYQNLEVDDATVFSPTVPPSIAVTYNACGVGCSGNSSLGSNINWSTQIDNKSPAGTNNSYTDKLSYIVW